MAPPGTAYDYNGGGTTVLGAAVAKATGQRLDDYARDKLFAPLDITDFEWVSCLPRRTSRQRAPSGLRLRPRDTAKLGQLMLSDGAWNGKQVLPKGWAAKSIKPRINGEGLLLLRLSMVARPQLPQRRRTHLGGRRRLWRPAPVSSCRRSTSWSWSMPAITPAPLQGVIPLGIFNRIVLPAVKD